MTFQRKNRFSLINLEINLIPHVKWDYIACSYCNHTWIDGIFRFATHYIRLLPFATHYIYNIGVLTVNIEFMWRSLETGGKTSFYPAIKFAKKNVNKFNNKKKR